MKKLLSLALVMTLLMGVLAVLPVSASTSETLDDHLISHWDFAGDTPLADKAQNGTADTMIAGGSATAGNGTAYIPDWANSNSNHYFYVNDSEDLFRTTEDRTIYVKFMSDKGNFDTDDASKSDYIELLAQNGAMRVGINGETSKLFGSTNAHYQSTNAIDSTNMPAFVANTWTTVAISWDKDTTANTLTVTASYKQGDSDWVTSVKTYENIEKTWTEDDSNAGATDPNYLSIGRRTFSTASSWGGSLTIDDIRIYDKALTANEVQSIKVSDRNIDDYLITHWDFVGSNPLVDKATKGSVSDTIVLNGSSYVSDDGTVTVPSWLNSHSLHYLSVADSNDLMRTTSDRTIYMVFKSTLGDFANDGKDTDWIELAGQNGAMRVGINANNSVFASTNSHTQGENAADSTGMNTFAANTWTTLAISWDKDTSSDTLVVTAAFKVGNGDWITTSVTRTATGQTWFEDNSDSGANDTEDLIIGRRSFNFNSTWGGDVTFDDIRIYNCALNVNEMKSITISNDQNDPATPGEGDGSVTNKGHSLTVADDIGVNFHVAVNESVKAEATVEIVKDEEKLYSGKLTDNPTDANGNYKLSGNVAPKEMGDTVTVTVKDGDGNAVYTNSYSAKEYIEYVIENKKDDTKLVSLVKAMANYGAYAQTLFNYKTDELINSVLPEAERELADVTKEDLGGAKVNGANAIDGVKYMGATLVLEENTHVVFSFTVDTSKVTISDANVSESDYVYNAAKGNLQVKSKGLVAKNLAVEQIVTITVDGQELKVAYSPMMYIMNMIDHSDADVANVVKALYAYYVAADAYVG